MLLRKLHIITGASTTTSLYAAPISVLGVQYDF